MREATLWTALRALDVRPDRMTMHGFRAMARTLWFKCWAFGPISSSISWPTPCGIPTDGPTTGARSC